MAPARPPEGGRVGICIEIYLRTGRRIAASESDLETKFNPWHDPEDGRFTFAGQSRFFPGRTRSDRADGSSSIGGRGGSYGGGGASESWRVKLRAKPELARSKPPQKSKVVASIGRTQAPLKLEPRVQVPSNGYNFSIDAHARPRQIAGELTLQLHPRSRSSQANAGKPDRRATDHGGHYIASRFNGPREWFNHFAQDASFNRSEYFALENAWAKAVRSGKRVFVDIVPHYHGTSMRPHSLFVTWIIDGQRRSREFANEKQGK